MRIAGINIPDEKRIEVALSYIHGVGKARAREVLAKAGIDADKRAKTLSQAEANKIKEVLDKDYKIEGELRQIKRGNINMLKELGTYRGSRHAHGLPARGQSTKRNSRTVR